MPRDLGFAGLTVRQRTEDHLLSKLDVLVPKRAFVASDQDVVGFWHAKFVSHGSNGIPDGTEVDAGYAQWHSDGTEIMNSAGRSPTTNAFCLGVWQAIGHRQFQLNHFARAYDAMGTHLIGPANLRETVTVGPKGKHLRVPSPSISKMSPATCSATCRARSRARATR